ncbi:hypothetical protein [Fusibacillus kribbianus]|uniref:Uncharacterized protein n=1 Tax=Fusibacillus kribbianus TaxID=3044208 RepID=A0AAP4F0G7_9FIRM|nr:hypothetical protein [Ruminococcus sp. YH-rum2234]MDI9241828.1 hypothetical protein [Ruminococcus sp. YH-rum2234]
MMSRDRMNQRTYESPRFEFEEMRLTEKIADKCWGYAYAWYDTDKDGVIDDGERVVLASLGLGPNGCQGSSARDVLKDHFKKVFGVDLTDEDVSTNTLSKSVIGSNS